MRIELLLFRGYDDEWVLQVNGKIFQGQLVDAVAKIVQFIDNNNTAN